VVEKTLTYKKLDEITTNVAVVIRKHMAPGERAVLVYPPSLDFMIAFIACLKAGVIAVPVFPPNPTRRDTLQMFGKIVAGCGATVALTNTEYNHVKKVAGITQVFGKLRGVTTAWPESLQWVVTDGKNLQVSGADAKAFTVNSPDPGDVAFLQYTSGSTSDPKGVMISHGNLGHNLTIITNELKAGTDTVVVSWVRCVFCPFFLMFSLLSSSCMNFFVLAASSIPRHGKCLILHSTFTSFSVGPSHLRNAVRFRA
jgi:acyl-CoA synthetase (AMP-forming)/AMP-acid ligase II